MEVDFAIIIDINLIDHVVDHSIQLIIVDGIMLFFQCSLQIIGRYQPITVGIKVCKHISKLLLTLNVFHLSTLFIAITFPSVIEINRNLLFRYRQRLLTLSAFGFSSLLGFSPMSA